MSKTHATYIAMVAVFGLGLWGILRVGATLQAAKYVAGDWRVRWSNGSASQHLPDRLTIEQSGRYLTVTLRRPESMGPIRLRGELRTSNVGQGRSDLTLASSDGRWNMTATLDETNQLLSGHLAAPQSYDWQARRILAPPAASH